MIFICLAPFALLNGILFAFALYRVNFKNETFLYKKEAIGAMAGAIIITFLLSGTFSSIFSALLTGLVICIIIIIVFKSFVYYNKKIKIFSFSIVAFISLLLIVPIDEITFKYQWKKILSEFSLSKSIETKYGRISVLKNKLRGQTLIYHNGETVGTFELNSSDPDKKNLSILIGCLHPEPKKVLLIGGAVSGFPELLIKQNIENIDLVELDPEMFKIMDKLYPGNINPRINRICGDGREFVIKSTSRTYDMVILFLPEIDNFHSNRFCTKGFFSHLYKILSSKGLVCIFLPSYGAAPEYTGKSLALRSSSILFTLDLVFKFSSAAPIGGHLLVAAKQKGIISFEPEILAERLRKKNVYIYEEIEYKNSIIKNPLPGEFFPTYFSSIFGGILKKQEQLFSERNTSLRESFENDLREAGAKPNLDNHPAAILYSIGLWNIITSDSSNSKNKSKSDNFSDIFESLIKNKALILTLFVSFLFLLIYIFRLKRKNINQKILYIRIWILFIAFSSGVFAMVIEISLLNIYQNVSGYVYAEVAIIMAGFMGGLSAGAYLISKINFKPLIGIISIILVMVILCRLTPALSEYIYSLESGTSFRFVFAFLVFLAGALNGALFPLLVLMWEKGNKSKAGVFIYASDLFGAFIGVIFAGSILIPILGIKETLNNIVYLLFFSIFGLFPLLLLKNRPHS